MTLQKAQQIIQQATAALVPYARNSRTHSDQQIAQIASSIREFGFTNPVLVDNDNGIVAGHGRVLAAQQLGMAEVPTINVGWLSEAQRRAYVIADNQLALNAGWDESVLAQEVALLNEQNFSTDLLGFDADYLDGLLAIEDSISDGLTDDDDVPEVLPDTISKIGDVWLLGRHRVMCGDSTSIDAVDKLMLGQKADMVFTDPPYGVSYEGGHNLKKRKGIIADTLEGENLTGLFYGALMAAIAFTKDGAAFYVWYASAKSIETFAALSDLPLKLRAVIQWYKVKSGLGAFMSQYIPNAEPCMYLHKEGCAPAWYGPTNEKTVWELKKESRNDYHPTQKPVGLPERAVNNSSKAGDYILDLFGGSGSTLIACEKMGREARLMELDPKYCDVIVRRWQAFTGKRAVLESTGQPFPDTIEAAEAATA